MDRKPPIEVRRQLRKEVGFGCPVPDCGNPYLYWHHFDPPWREREHHDPAGMIALCSEHHAKADAGAFTLEQLRELKQSGQTKRESIAGRIDWMRKHVLSVIGGSFAYECPTLFEIGGRPVIWYRRDENGYLLLNIDMLSISSEPRLRLEDNFWVLEGQPLDFECPPSGRIIEARYANGDVLRVEFWGADSAAELTKAYPYASPVSWPITIPFPITVVEIQNTIAGSSISFGQSRTRIGNVAFRNGFFVAQCGVGFSVDHV